MEELPTRPLGESIPAAAATLGRESWADGASLFAGDAGRDAIRATRITRQTIRGKDGGVYYVLAPGPSLMLAPALRLDRAINLAAGRAGTRRGERASLVRAGRAPGGGALPAGAGRDGAARAWPRRSPSASRSCRPSSSTPSSSTRRWWGRWSWPWPSGRCALRPGGPAAAPVALRHHAGDAAVAAPEVPAGVARARGDGAVGGAVIPRSFSLAVRRGVRNTGGSFGTRPVEVPQDDKVDRRPGGADAGEPLPDRALQLRDHRERAAGRALPGVGAGRRDARARGPGRPRPAARRAVRDPAVRARPDARGRRPGPRRGAALRRGDAGGRGLLPDRGLGRQLGRAPCATSAATSCRWRRWPWPSSESRSTG